MNNYTTLKDIEKSISLVEKTFKRWLDVYRRLGLSDNIDEAIEEMGLLIDIIRAHKNFVAFKQKQLEKKKDAEK